MCSIIIAHSARTIVYQLILSLAHEGDGKHTNVCTCAEGAQFSVDRCGLRARVCVCALSASVRFSEHTVPRICNTRAKLDVLGASTVERTRRIRIWLWLVSRPSEII